MIGIDMTTLPRLSAHERRILELLIEHGELFGLQMVELSAGALKRGTVYVTLGRMQEKGYLESRQEPLPDGAIGRLPRRLYRPTAYARHVLAAWHLAEAALAGIQPQEA
jgi:PadR family transcriptional regulator, regulatory protein PadR